VKLRFTKRAVRQIEEIIDAIALESPQGARRVRERMQSITTLLIEHPHIGADRSCGHPADAGQPLSLPDLLSRYRGCRDCPARASRRAQPFGRSTPSLNDIGGPAAQERQLD
jgi:plasmid stabilization system protein ParE